MKSLPARILDLCLLRSGPQDLPYSIPLTRNLVIITVGVDLLYAHLLQFPHALPRIALSLGMLLGAPWLLLGLRQRRERYAQTLAALAGSSIALSMLTLPLALYAVDLPTLTPETKPTPGQLAFAWASLILVSWKLVINSHIYRHALDWPRMAAMLLAFGLFVFELGLDQLLVPRPAGVP